VGQTSSEIYATTTGFTLNEHTAIGGNFEPSYALDVSGNIRGSGKGMFGDGANSTTATRSLNSIGSDGLMRLWRQNDSFGPSFELITSDSGIETINHRWDIGLDKSGVLFIRRRNFGGTSNGQRFVNFNGSNTGFGGETSPSHPVDVNGRAQATTLEATDTLLIPEK